MKKLTFNIFYVVLGLIVLAFVISLYIKPNESLTLQSQPIDIYSKLNYMVTNLKTEVVLTEQEIDSLIKQHLDPQLTKQLTIEGAHFYLENNHLYAKLNVIYAGRIRAELNASYLFSLSNEGMLSLNPDSIRLKDIPLPLSLLQPIDLELYDLDDTIVKVTEVQNNGRQLSIRWKISLF